MKLFDTYNDPEILHLLKRGGVGVLRTDTLYGVVALADNEQAVERVYGLKNRDRTKSPIILIGALDQLFDQPNEQMMRLIDEKWPGKVSIIIPSLQAPEWISRTNESVAYRLPTDEKLQHFLLTTGPLIAPSANPEGQPPAVSIQEAAAYFGGDVDFYVDGGEITDETPSQLLRLTNDGILERLR